MKALLPPTLALTLSACATTGVTPRPFPVPDAAAPAERTAPAAAAPAGPASGYAVAGTALGLRGTPYRNGGGDPSGFDCSGLVAYVFRQHGVRVPRTVAEQFRAGQAVDRDLQPGDLVFFNIDGRGASHVGISLGGDEFVHAPSSSGEVRVERLGSSYWSGRYVGARRVL